MAPKVSFKGGVGVFKIVDNVKKLTQGVELLAETTVMVGVPEDKNDRRQGQISNAALAYIHDKGSVLANIPKREFMEPGVAAVKREITELLIQATTAVLKGAKTVEGYLTKIGLITTRSIKSKITEGIPPPLAPSTIKGRIARIKGKKRKDKIMDALASGTPASRQSGAEGVFTPLVVTSQLRNAITFVLRKLRKGARR